MKYRTIFLALFFILLSIAQAHSHRSGCHRWHSCPSDSESYVCGDTGHCSECPDNQYCQGGKPRTTARVHSQTTPPPPTIATKPQRIEEGTVTRVADGDTLVASSALSQTAVVTQPVHLRTDPSTDHPPIRLLYPPERLQLIPPKEQGDFYHVRTGQGEAGWTWKRNVSVYNRDEWMRHGRWIDADRDCQTTRHEVLIEESATIVLFDTRGCVVMAGTWHDPYGGETFTNPSDLDIDHLVPLAHVHVSGGWAWEPERKQAYANDLANPEHLIAVNARLNRQKGDRGPDQWKPPQEEFWCEYATAWLAVKRRWQLMLTADEAAAVAEMMRTCP